MRLFDHGTAGAPTTEAVGPTSDPTFLRTVVAAVLLGLVCLFPMAVGLLLLYGARAWLRERTTWRVATLGYVVALAAAAVAVLPGWRRFGVLTVPLAVVVAGMTTVGVARTDLSVGQSVAVVAGLLSLVGGVSAVVVRVLLGRTLLPGPLGWFFPFVVLSGLLFPLGVALRPASAGNRSLWVPLLLGAMVVTVVAWVWPILPLTGLDVLIVVIGSMLTVVALVAGTPLFVLGLAE